MTFLRSPRTPSDGSHDIPLKPLPLSDSDSTLLHTEPKGILEPPQTPPTKTDQLTTLITERAQTLKNTCTAYYTYKPCRYTIYGIIGFFLVSIIFTPLFLRFALPAIIESQFSNGALGNNAPIVISLFRLDAMNATTKTPGTLGTLTFSTNLTQGGYNGLVPFGIPLYIGGMTWTVELGVKGEGNSSGYVRTTESFYEIAEVTLKEGVSVLGGNLGMSVDHAVVKVLDLGETFVQKVLGCLMSGYAADGPRVRVSANVDIGWVSVVVFIGMPFPLASTNPVDPSQSFHLYLSNAKVLLSGGDTTALTSLQFRLNISQVPAYSITAPVVYAEQGSPNVTIGMNFGQLGSTLDLVSSLLLQQNLKVGIDRVDVRDAVGGRIGWLSDLCAAVWVQLPLSLLGNLGSSFTMGSSNGRR
ncbi:hypothetical protein BCR33DRAFT_723828 [Rhizoclosmatium globosum]|uniref:Uncharacterized protein n=1 Tax=Rhizoclosmatium globosum TaxID=329046 RepID=A0A1Y2BA73_9FUNG|nr:hypothetical protein BCR33DRAFT_723828 [Rhizoclosmatium globosum]|eukprot:ORY31749.1 hypothetical protein BCR33DRAFT_723828 [Rhizoclosmatium globosum]